MRELPAADGNDHQLAQLVDERGSWLLRCAYLLTRDSEAALDLTQDTLLQAWRAWAKVERADHPDRYILRIMLNLYRSQQRRGRVLETPLLLQHDHQIADPRDITAGVDVRDTLSAALGELKPRQRAAVVMRYWLDYDDATIAELLGCRRATVRSLIARSLPVLRNQLPEETT